MAIEHVLTDTDSLHSLAYSYLNDPLRWKEIADFNKLDYPYIVKDESELGEYYASGFLKVTRNEADTIGYIPAGAVFKTRPGINGALVRRYTVVDSVTFGLGSFSEYIFVRSTLRGSFGNTAVGTISELENPIRGIEIVSIVQESPFTNGKDVNVKITGSSIFIPSEDGTDSMPLTLEGYLAELGGEDLYTDSMVGIFTDKDGDISSVNGIENIKQAVQARLMTEKGELVLHPEYGTNIPKLIGQASSLPYLDRLIQIEILEALALEDRIQDVQITALERIGTAVYVELAFRPLNAQKYEKIKLRLNY